MSDPNPQLSSYERKRREEILRLAMHAANRRRWKRRSFNTAVLLMIGTLLAITLLWRESPKPVYPIVQLPAPTSNPELVARHQVILVRIVDDPGVVRRLTIPPSQSNVRQIGDDQLLKELTAAQEPAGLAYVNGKAELIYR